LKEYTGFLDRVNTRVSVRKGDLEDLLKELDKKIIYLRKTGRISAQKSSRKFLILYSLLGPSGFDRRGGENSPGI